MSGLITPVAANSRQLPPAVPHNVVLAIAPITHDPTTWARPLRQSVITRCGLRSTITGSLSSELFFITVLVRSTRSLRDNESMLELAHRSCFAPVGNPARNLYAKARLGSPPNNTVSFVSSAKYMSTVSLGCNALASNYSQAVAGSIANALYSAALILS